MSIDLKKLAKQLWNGLKNYWQAFSFAGIVTLLSWVLMIIGGAVDVPDFIERYINKTPTLELSYTPNKQVNPSDKITLTYKATDAGYLSLWHIAPDGKTTKLLPRPNSTNTTVALNEKIQSSTIGLTIGEVEGTNQVLLIWTPDKAEHLNHNEYAQKSEFEANLQALEGRETVVKKLLDIPVYPKKTK